MTNNDLSSSSKNDFKIFKSELAKDSDESKLFEKMGKRLVNHFETDVEGFARLDYQGFIFQFKFLHKGQKWHFSKDFFMVDVPIIVNNDDVFDSMMTWTIADIHRQINGDTEAKSIFG